jgi:MoCo/4Fe-4S cofactor protein with predicted Tat translocation signal
MSSTDFIALPVLQPSVPQEKDACGCHSHDEDASISKVAAQLSAAKGKAYWRSLDELQDTPEFRQFLETEFPTKHELWSDDLSRRDFLKLMGASMAMMFFAGCRKPIQKIFPYQEQPENVIPGKSLFFATALPFAGYAQGVLVETHEGKPSKIEGNPQHPDTLGSSDIFMQADVLGLYDPDRSQTPINQGIASSWDSFMKALRDALEAQSASGGAGLRLLTQTVTSPTLADQIRLMLKRFPKATWHQYEPFARHNARAGAVLAFGEPHDTHYDLAKADVIVSLDSDFMTTLPGKLRYAREFAAGRNLTNGRTEMNRLYVIEPSPTITGSSADHRLALKSSEIESFTRSLAGALGIDAARAEATAGRDVQQWLHAITKDLQEHRGHSVIIAGDGQPAAVHALAHAMNEALGNVGQTVSYTAPVEAESIDQLASIKDLVDAMNNKQVDLLVIAGGNPVFDTHADLNFTAAMDLVRTRVHLSLYEDETSNHCHWHINEAHPLESWGDLRAVDGTVTIQQPMIEPLYGGRSAIELVSALVHDDGAIPAHDAVKDYWKRKSGSLSFENFWKTSLHNGIVTDTALPMRRPRVRGNFGGASKPRPPEAMELIFRVDSSVWDGRYANNGWLQELPKPITKITWDNVAQVSPAAAEKLGLENGDIVDLAIDGRSVKAPVYVTPGHADDSVTVTAGYGRTLAGRVGNDKGFNAYAIRTTANPDCASGLQLSRTGGTLKLAFTQTHHSVEGRSIVRNKSLQEYLKEPKAFEETDYPGDKTLYNTPKENVEYAWAMSIDMNSCIGCNACMIGCQSENNISVVGKDQVIRGREMHWIRVDNYFSGTPEEPEFTHQPVPCMHCENAPCEPVCPPGATVHNDEGLNEMIYNRCIGTRYCSNNCPYKVRRFNFYQYSDQDSLTLKMRNNPNVTVRSRGVMEKCTYCIQRINESKITAELENRSVRDGDIVTACQSACPTRAITFGNINDPNSAVSRLKAEPRNYPMLGDLGVRPRTTYLAKVRNLNPDLSS